MDTDRYRRLRDAFVSACDLASDRQREIVEALAADDPELGEELRSLLGHDVTATLALDEGLRPFDDLDAVGPPPGTRVGRYELIRSIGRGGSGEVFEASVVEPSSALGGRTRVAVKILHRRRTRDERALRAFRREAELGAAVEHPHVARTFEAGHQDYDGRPLHFLAMELVEGRTLDAYAAEFDRMPEPLIRHIGAALARGLAALHRAGIVHRDVKPANVVITPDEVVKLTDLGIAVDPDTLQQEADAGRFTGTVAYAAPEQLGGPGDIGPATDLHALGIVLDELTTGAHPYRREGLDLTVRAILRGDRARASRTSSHDLTELIATLLAALPQDRPSDAETVADALVRGRSSHWWRSRHSTADDALQESEGPLRGRDAELTLLTTRLLEIRERRPLVAMLRGIRGSGRTRLLAEAIRSARRGGLVPVLHVRVRGPGLAARWTDEPGEAIDVTAGRAVERVLSGARKGPALIVADDLDLASERDRRVFTALGRAVEGRSVAVIGTELHGDDAGPSALATVVGSLDDSVVIRLDSMDGATGRTIVRDRLEDAELADEVWTVVERIGERTPGGIGESLRHLERGGFLERLPDGGWFRARAVEEVSAPPALEERVRRWCAGLDHDEQELPAAAAALGSRVPTTDLAIALERSELQVLRAVHGLGRDGSVLRAAGEFIVFEPRQARDVVLDWLGSDRVRKVSGRLAGLLAAQVDAEDRADGISLLAVAARDEHLIVRHAREGAARLGRSDRLVEQARVAEALANIESADPRERIEAWMVAAKALELLGDDRGRRRLLEPALELARTIEWGSGIRRLVLLLVSVASADSDHALLERTVAEALTLDGLEPTDRIWAQRELIRSLMTRGRVNEAETLLATASETATDTWDLVTLGLVRLEILVRTGRITEAEAELARLAPLVAEVDVPRATFGYRLAESTILRRTGRLEEGWRCLEIARAEAERSGDRQRLRIVLGQMGILAHARLDFAGARRALSTVLSLGREFGSDTAQVLAWLGDLERSDAQWRQARARLEEALSCARERDDGAAELSALKFMVALERDLGRLREALVAAESQLARAERVGHPFPVAVARAAVGTSALGLGDLETAETELRAAHQTLARTPSPHRVPTALALARLAQLRDDDPSAQEWLEHARAAAEQTKLDEARGTFAAFAGPWAAARGDTNAALVHARVYRRVARAAGQRGGELEAISLLARLSGPPPDDALVAEALRLFDDAEDRIPLPSRVRALSNLSTAGLTHRLGDRVTRTLRTWTSVNPDVAPALAAHALPELEGLLPPR